MLGSYRRLELNLSLLMIVVEANGKKVTCATCWEECNTDLFQRLERKPGTDDVEIFSILSGTNYTSLLEEVSEDLDAAIYQCTAFVFGQDRTFMRYRPSTMKLRGKVITVPTDLESLSIGQNLHIRQAIAAAKKEGHSLESLISVACSVYLQPLVDESKFDSKRAAELEKEILQMSIYDTYGIGFFYLSKLMNSGGGGLLSWLPRIAKRIASWRRSLRWRVPASLSRSTMLLSSTLMQRLTASFHALCSTSPSMSLCPSCICGRSRASIDRATRQQRKF